MDISTTSAGAEPAVRVELVGELDMSAVPAVDRALSLIDTGQPRDITVDLAKLTFCDCAGVAEFIAAHHRAKVAGSRLTLARPQPAVERLLELTGTDWLIDPEAALVA